MQQVADQLGLSLEVCLVIFGLCGTLVSLLTINQIVAALSDTKKVPSSIGMVDIKQKKAVRDRFLITGPTFAGKTQLYYKLKGGNIDVSLSSSELNETEGAI